MDKESHELRRRCTNTSGQTTKLRWKDVVNTDLRKKQLNIALASDRSKWRNAIRPVTQQNALQPTMSGKRRGNDQ